MMKIDFFIEGRSGTKVHQTFIYGPCIKTMQAIGKIKACQLTDCKDEPSPELKEKIDATSQDVHLIVGKFKGSILLPHLWEKQKQGGPIPLYIPFIDFHSYYSDDIEAILKKCDLREEEIEVLKTLRFVFVFDGYAYPANFYCKHEINQYKNHYQGQLISICDPDRLEGPIENNLHLFAPLDNHHQIQADHIAITQTTTELRDIYWV